MSLTDSTTGLELKTVDRKLRTSSMPYLYDIVAGNIADHLPRHILGYRPLVTSAFNDLSEMAATVIPLPASAIAMEVVGHADDDVAGAGALTVEVHGLDTNWDMTNETVIMTGVVPVACSNTYRRINNIHVMTTGANGVATGPINIQAAGAGTIYSIIGAGENMSLQAHYTVPDGYTAYIEGWTGGFVTVSSNTAGRLLLRATVDWEVRTLASVFHSQDIILGQVGTFNHNFDMPLMCPARTDIKITAERTLGAQSLSAAGSIQLWLEK